MSSFICHECGTQIDSIVKFTRHCTMHGLDHRTVYTNMFLGGVEPTCACGCGKIPKFDRLATGFSKFMPGHQARINNNWGHNKVALDKSHETCRTMRKNGEIVQWTTGLTKETDERLAAYGRKGSETIRSNQEEIKKRSQRMSKNRLDRTIPNLYGSDHPKWNGGVSTLSALCHGNNRLYKEWKFPKMKTANFNCVQCGSNKNICVHHDKERMADIIRKFSILANYNGRPEHVELAILIADKVAEYHVNNDVSGSVLCEKCHEKEHASLNFHRSSIDKIAEKTT